MFGHYLIDRARPVNNPRKDREMRNQIIQLANDLHIGLFASRDTIGEAFDFAENMIESMPESGARAAARTALHVMVNSIAKQLRDIAGQELPAPPAEVRIAPEDHPDVGADPMAALFESMVGSLSKKIDDMENNIEALTERFEELDDDIEDRVEGWVENNFDVTEEVREALNGLRISLNLN